VVFFLVQASSAAPENNCTTECPSSKDVIIPDCGDQKMVPISHPNCGCLLKYTCCPSSCPKVMPNCAKGTFAINETDCCGCGSFKCEQCAKIPLPKCSRLACEDIQLEETSVGCPVPICRTRCPKPQMVQCPVCQHSEIFINATLCGCQDVRCRPKPCPAPSKLDAADFPCHSIVDTKDECGCQIFKPSRQSYCEPINKKAKAFVCTDEKLPGQCFENVVNERADGCGCHTQDCVSKVEAVVDKYKDRNCPRGYFMISGVTPCNRPRDACIKCAQPTVERRQL